MDLCSLRGLPYVSLLERVALIVMMCEFVNLEFKVRCAGPRAA